ncbi:2-oxoglutarate and iron-dependent oxygenase domain-containing protein 3-like [Ornithodoros turicata]
MNAKRRKGPSKAEERKGSEHPAKAPLNLRRRVTARVLLSLALIAVLYLSAVWRSNVSTTFASFSENLTVKFQAVTCSNDYINESHLFPECVPRRCGRVASDSVVTPEEVTKLRQIVQNGMALSRSSGGASILDLHSGSVSHGEGFVNIYKFAKKKGVQYPFNEEDFQLYRQVKDKVHTLVSHQFAVPPKHLYLTHPTFFSEMTDREARTVHDNYWQIHVDKETYGSFHYTSLVYLSDYGQDFEGGRLIFVSDAGNATVEPKKGRIVSFTSGSENPHHVEKVMRGVRYALTVSFSCDPAKAIEDPRPAA